MNNDTQKTCIQCKLRENDRVFFMHIPKTAGITFRNILENQFDYEKICPAYYVDQLKEFSLDQLKRFRLFRGHIFLSDLKERLPEESIKCVTMLRDPVKYTLSHFEHIKRDQTGIADDVIYHRIRTMSFEDFIRAVDSDPHSRLLFDNLQTRFFLNDPKRRYERLCDQDLDTAKENLGQFSFFGMVEKFEASMQLLSHTFKWRPPEDSYQLNKAPQKPGGKRLDQDTIDVIKKNMRFDIKLYQYARQLFSERFDKMIDQLAGGHRRRGASRSGVENQSDPLELNSMLRKNHGDRYGHRRRLESVALTFGQVIDGSGWYPPKQNAAGKVYRWTGPSTVSEINIPLKTTHDLRIQFKIMEAMSFEILKSLALTVNGEPIALSVFTNDAGQTIFEGIIPQAAITKDPTKAKLAFSVDKALSPGAIVETKYFLNSLPHGLAFEWLKILPLEKGGIPADGKKHSLNQIERRDILDIQIMFNISQSPDMLADLTKIRRVDIPWVRGGYFERLRSINGKHLACSGWARDFLAGAPSSRVMLINQHREILAASLVNEEREDVAEKLKNSRLLRSGWRVYFDRRHLKPGPNRIRAYACAKNKKMAIRLKGEFYAIRIDNEDFIEAPAKKMGEMTKVDSRSNSPNLKANGWLQTAAGQPPADSLFILNQRDEMVAYTMIADSGITDSGVKQSWIKGPRFKGYWRGRGKVHWRVTINRKHLIQGINQLRAYAFCSKEKKAVRLAGGFEFNNFPVEEFIDNPISIFGYVDNLVRVNKEGDMEVSGWAIDATQGNAAGGVIVTAEDKRAASGQGGEARRKIIARVPVDRVRDDVATAFNNAKFKRCGWMAAIGHKSINKKGHLLRAYAYSPEYKRAIRLKGEFGYPNGFLGPDKARRNK